jgi:hypothetical protein
VKLGLAIVAVGLGIPFLAPAGALACSCATPSFEEGLASSDGAFIGRLLAVREVDPPGEGEPIGSGDPMNYVYRVGRVVKPGPGLRRGRRVKVRSARSSATCGLPRGRGRLFGLFVVREDGRWHGNLCQVISAADMRRGADGSASPAEARPGSPASGSPLACPPSG